MQEIANQIVVFKLNNQLYGVFITQVKEIIKLVNISKLPDMPHYISGVINLRGKLYFIYDLKNKFGIETTPFDDNTKIIIINQKSIGFIVDEVTEIISVEEDKIERIGDFNSGVKKWHITGIVKRDENIIALLDLKKSLDYEDEIEI